MLTASMRVSRQFAMRFFNRVLLSLIILCLTQAAAAQQPVAISPSVVLVLKLISNTHVKPTTGIVVSDDGLVLVSREFVSTDGEMIVLDGGTDILSNGRPATIVAQSLTGNLAILSVEGLKRPGITLSDNELIAAGKLHLEAFPPAEYIAKGAPPLSVALDFNTGRAGVQQTVSLKTPLPFVSGAIIDDCGYLGGVSLTNGPQSLETGKAPLILFKDELGRVLSELQITLPAAKCTPPARQPEPPAKATVNESEPADVTQAQEQVQDSNQGEVIEPELTEPIGDESPAVVSQGVVTEPPDQFATKNTEPPSIWRDIPIWLPVLGIIILGGLIWKALLLFRIHKNTPEQNTAADIASQVQPASDEPVTAPLEISTENGSIKPRSAPVFDLEIPESMSRPDGCNGVLLVEGLLDAETVFKRFCFVNTEQVSIIIGRGDKDINIEHAAISRNHVRIESDGATSTLSDLGSKNGTFIGDVPCLPGEVLYFKADDEIFLGDVKLTIRVITQEAEWA